MLKPDFTFTKRQLGILGIVGGSAALIGVLLYDQLGMSDPQGGFGPSQVVALAGALLMVVVGFSLLPLGDDPA